MADAVTADALLAATRARGFDFWTGVPCSFLTPVINAVISDPHTPYVGAANEGEAVGIAAGAWLAGRRTVVMCQNSGLGNTVNPLTSLNWPFRIPTLLIVTWRGQPGLTDEPQHELMGEITPDLLDVLRVPHAPFPRAPGLLDATLDRAVACMDETRLPFALIMEKGSVADVGLTEPTPPERPRGSVVAVDSEGPAPARMEALQTLLQHVPKDAAIIATTGKCGRELFTLADRRQHLYQVGSMGCASAMGLGVALHTPRPVVVLDGDGAALMKLGNLATTGAEAPRNLLHIVLDNGVHDSTGGQATTSPTVDFASVALGCGYRWAGTAASLSAFAALLDAAWQRDGPGLVHLHIRPGSASGLGRPTVKPPAVADRFKAFLQS